MNPNDASPALKWKVGLFTLAGIIFIGFLTVYVNNRPFWWRACHPFQIVVEDATGITLKSPVKSLGLQIGFVENVELVDDGVRINICITAPVTVLADTRAYVRSEGFLGDKFLELKPVRMIDAPIRDEAVPKVTPTPVAVGVGDGMPVVPRLQSSIMSFFIESAYAQEESTNKTEIPVAGKQADVQQVVNQMNGLVTEVKTMTTSLKNALDPEELKSVVHQLNKTLENAASTLSPENGLTTTAKRALMKLEDAIEQLKDQITRINQGQGSVGMILNDPTYAEELKKALVGINKLLGTANEFRFQVHMGVDELNAYDGTRANFDVQIWTRKDRYYLIGIVSDPRGSIYSSNTTTTVGGQTTTVDTTQVQKGGFTFDAMVGQLFFQRFVVAVGLLNGDGDGRLAAYLGWDEHREALQVYTDLYFRSQTINDSWTVQPNFRAGVLVQPISIFAFDGGLEGIRKVNGTASFFYGASIRFDDDDIKLFAKFL